MDKAQIQETIRALISDIAEDMDVDTDKITDSAHFITDLGLDSMALLEVLATMEKKFSVQIPESEFSNLTSINACTATVEKYLAAKK
jgi:acyl carrier protein